MPFIKIHPSIHLLKVALFEGIVASFLLRFHRAPLLDFSAVPAVVRVVAHRLLQVLDRWRHLRGCVDVNDDDARVSEKSASLTCDFFLP